jgi:DNA topoisomerase-1
LFINIPARYKFDTINEAECADLIEKKIEKEANRFLRDWPEEKIAIENGRWGPFIRFGKKMLKLVGGGAQGKYTAEELVVIDLEEVKKMILIQEPKAFDKKTKAASKTAVKKAPAKKK